MLGDLSLAVIGCGAISESYYFPVLGGDARAREKVWLIDPSAERREKAAAQFGFRRGPTDRRHFGAALDGHGGHQRHAKPPASGNHHSADRARRQRDRGEASCRDSRRRQTAGRRRLWPLRAHRQPLSPPVSLLFACAGSDRRRRTRRNQPDRVGRRAEIRMADAVRLLFPAALEDRSSSRRIPGHWRACARRRVLVARRGAQRTVRLDGRLWRPRMLCPGRTDRRRRRDRPCDQLSFETRQCLHRRRDQGRASRLGHRFLHHRSEAWVGSLAVDDRPGSIRMDGFRAPPR